VHARREDGHAAGVLYIMYCSYAGRDANRQAVSTAPLLMLVRGFLGLEQAMACLESRGCNQTLGNLVLCVTSISGK